MKDAVTASDALGMTALKAGGLGELAAVFGASLATDDTETVRLFGELGFNLFTYAQLVDDLRDAFPSQGSSSDWEQGKKTLPLLFFRNSLREKRLDVRTHDGMMPVVSRVVCQLREGRVLPVAIEMAEDPEDDTIDAG